MKKLSIEQKAQRYDKALEIINDYYQKIKYSSLSNALTDREVLKKAFPQLKESEDEKLREQVVYAINQLHVCECTKNKLLAWLEKQGQKPQGKSAFEAAKEEKVNNQNCVKPADKVEPKFHKGEWLCENEPNNYARFIQILEIVNIQRYRISRDIHNDEDIVEVRFVEKYYHKFDIKDAKDGDILMANAPFIFNGNLEGGIGCPGAHCGINTLGKFQIPTNPKHWTGHTTTPATKEQRDTLMKAMADAGYTFDFEKKELKKIEQKPAWSEEDETKIKSIIALLKSPALCAMDGNKGIIDESIKYLKSIKDRVQPQHKEWSEEDEKIIKRIDSLLYSQCKIHGSEYEEIHNWFKSLSPQSTWKPSDEQMDVLLSEVTAWTKGCPKQIVLESLYNDLKNLK